MLRRMHYFNLYLQFSLSQKVRLDPEKMLIIRNDNQFARMTNQPRGFIKQHYGSARSCCFSGKACKYGLFRVDLSGTGLRLQSQVRWKSTSRQTWIGKSGHSENYEIYYSFCQGSCGECRPEHELSLSIKGC